MMSKTHSAPVFGNIHPPHLTAIDIVEAKRTSRKAPAHLSPLEVKTKVQKNALLLLEREEKNAKKGRLESLLLHQYLSKYGLRPSAGNEEVVNAINDTIKRSIREFIESYVNVHDAEPNIPVLESEISEKTRKLKDQYKEEKRQRKLMEERKAQQEQSNAERLRLEGEANKSLKDKKALEEFKTNQWPLINALMTVTEEEKKRQEQKEFLEKQKKFKQALDEQLSFQQRQEELTRREKEEQLEKMKSIQQQHENDVLLKKKIHEEHLKREREIRLSQIEERQRQKEIERQMRIQYEKNEMARAKRLAEEEEENRRLQKEAQKEAQDRLILENEQNKAIKLQQLREKQAYEKKLQVEYE